MNLFDLYLSSSDFYQPVKISLCFLAAMIAAALTGCGISTPGGYVMGTTGYLAEYNRAPIERITSEDQKQLTQLIGREGK